MKSPATMLAVALLAIGSLQASDSESPALPANLHQVPTAGPVNPDPPSSTVSVGDRAPDFSFESTDHHWRHLHDLLEQGGVLLVFAPDDEQLKTLEREREGMLQRGILSVAVLNRRDGATWATVNRLRLHFSALADPRGVIAEQFNLMDPSGPRCLPGWFMIDRNGRVRGLHRDGLPEADFTSLATRALGLPSDGVSLPAVTR